MEEPRAGLGGVDARHSGRSFFKSGPPRRTTDEHLEHPFGATEWTGWRRALARQQPVAPAARPSTLRRQRRQETARVMAVVSAPNRTARPGSTRQAPGVAS